LVGTGDEVLLAVTNGTSARRNYSTQVIDGRWLGRDHRYDNFL